MKSTKKTILISALSVAMSASLIAGATFAIFSSDSKANIAITSGEVKIEATANLTRAWSAKWDTTTGVYTYPELTVENNEVTFTNGGKGFYDAKEGKFKLDRITPGDKAEFRVDIVNYSNVKIKYWVKVAKTGDLLGALNIDGPTFDDADKDKDADGWITAGIPTGDSEVLNSATVTINFPIENASQASQTLSCEIAVSVIAYQQNAHAEIPKDPGDVTLDKNLMESVESTIKSSEISAAPAIIFGTRAQYEETIKQNGNYASFENGVEIPNSNGARMFYIQNDATAKMEAIYVLAEKITADANGSFTFADKGFTYVDLSGVNFSETTSVGKMFRDSEIETLIMKGVDLSAATDLNDMLQGCESLREVDFSGSDFARENTTQGYALLTENLPTGLTDLKKFFADCTKLAKVNFSDAHLEGLTNLERTFEGNGSLQEVDFSGAHLENVTSIGAMFRDCLHLTKAHFVGAYFTGLTTMATPNVDGESLDGQFNDEDIIIYDGAFDGCVQLTDINFSGADLKKVQNMAYLFYYCTALTEFTFSDVFGGCQFDSLTDIHQMFYKCYNLKTADFAGAQLGKVVKISELFHDCKALKEVSFANADLSSANYNGSNSMFNGCGILDKIDLTETKLGPDMLTGMGGATKSLNFKSSDFSKVESLYEMFLHNSTLTEIDFSYVEFTNVTNLYGMFMGCSVLETATFSHAKFPKVIGTGGGYSTGVTNMFAGCTSLISVDFSYAEFNELENLYKMFDGSSVKDVIFSYAQFPKVTGIGTLFTGAKNVESMDFSGADLHSITTGLSYFANSGFGGSELPKLQTADFSGANLSGVTTLYGMFAFFCPQLRVVDFSGANLSSLANTGNMFYNCANLEYIFVSTDTDWTAQITSGTNMFFGCTKLFDLYPECKKGTSSVYAKVEGGYFTVGSLKDWLAKQENA